MISTRRPPGTIGGPRSPGFILSAVALGTLLLSSACSNDGTSLVGADSGTTDTSELSDTADDTVAVQDAEFDATDWTDASHGDDVDPDFDEVFDDTQVKRLDLVITQERWQSMLDDMTATYGEFGTRSGAPGGGQPGVARPEGGAPPEGAQQAEVVGTAEVTDEDPVMVPAEVFYDGRQWYRVGIRFKGNSSLKSSWEAGILKLSFKLDFDEYEDDYPQVDNQRFYGFKKLSLKNNYDDRSELREKVASDVFRTAGVPVSHTAFFALHVDHGNGPEYFGVYTLVEEVDGSVLDTQFSSDDGNLYKPEEGSANFVEGTFDPQDFEKKTNEDDADWSDIESLFAALHDDTATTDPATWRANLEAVFDVDGFLKYLAVNGIIQNWDTYGRMVHNYYLYGDPETGKLTWIPWDNNEALQEGKQGGALELDFTDLDGDEWPLIARIHADDVYRARYDLLLADVMSVAFETSSMQARYDNYAALLSPYATTERAGYSFLQDSSDFGVAIDELKAHAVSRAAAVNSYLGN